MKNPLHTTSVFLGVYAGLIAIQHGIFEIMQGSRAPDGLMFNAIGPPCQPQTVWHACFPAMTLIPNLFITGIAAFLAGLGMAAWALFFAHRRYGGLVSGLLPLLALLVGGGFVPVFIGIIAGVATVAENRPGSPVGSKGTGRRTFSTLWYCPLILLALWLPGSWLLGFFFGEAMQASGGFLFLFFDIVLPILAVVFALIQNRHEKVIP